MVNVESMLQVRIFSDMPLRLVDLTQRYDIHDLNYRDPPMKLANNNSQNSLKILSTRK